VKYLYFVFILISLSNCSVYQDGFKCLIGKGESCKSLSYVDNNVDEGVYDEPVRSKGQSKAERLTIFYPKTQERLDLKIPDSAKK
jgi:hypothetical protein